jgi:hypothetical protein
MSTSKTRYTLAEAVRACGISQSYIRLLIRNGRLKTEPKAFAKEPMRVTRNALEDAGLTFDESAVMAMKAPTQRLAELEKENNELRLRLAQANAHAELSRQRAEVAESGLQIMRETLATVSGITLPARAPRDGNPSDSVHQFEQDYRDLTGERHHLPGESEDAQ